MSSGVKINVIDFLKLAPKYFLPLLIFSGIIIFIPYGWLEFLHLDVVVVEYKWIFSLIFIFALSMFGAGLLLKFYDSLTKRINKRKAYKNMKNKLKNLSETQRRILLNFVEENAKSVPLPIDSGEVNELVNCSIIYRASSISTDVGEHEYYFDYCLQPLAEKVIKKNIKILRSGRHMAEYKQTKRN